MNQCFLRVNDRHFLESWSHQLRDDIPRCRPNSTVFFSFSFSFVFLHCLIHSLCMVLICISLYMVFFFLFVSPSCCSFESCFSFQLCNSLMPCLAGWFPQILSTFWLVKVPNATILQPVEVWVWITFDIVTGTLAVTLKCYPGSAVVKSWSFLVFFFFFKNKMESWSIYLKVVSL